MKKFTTLTFSLLLVGLTANAAPDEQTFFGISVNCPVPAI